MRILTVVGRLDPESHGDSEAARLLELARRGHTLDIVALWSDLPAPLGLEALERRLVRAGIGVFELGLHGRLAAPEGAAKLARLIRRRGYDVVHAEGHTAALYTGLSAPLSPHPAQVVAVDRAPPPPTTPWMQVQARLRSRVLAGHGQTFVASHRAAAQACATSERPVEVIAPTVPAHGLQPELEVDREATLRPYGVGPDETVLFVPAYPTATSGHPVFIEALMHLGARGLRPRAILYGRGSIGQDLQALVQSAGLASQITLKAEALSHAARLDLMRVADLAVLPALSEGFPRAGAECMALEAPLVASAVGGYSDLVEDGQTGALFPAGDARALALRLQELLEAPERRGRFAVAARQRVLTHFSVDRIATKWEAFYARAVALKQGDAAA